MKLRKQGIITALSYFVLLVGLLWVALPFVWMLLTAFKPAAEVLKMPPKWFPSEWRWENFQAAMEAVPYRTYFINSIITATLITAGDVITSILAGYALACIPFRGKNMIFLVLLATMMVPSEILMIPNYITLSELGWINTYKALILPWCSSVFSIYLLRQQFSSFPKSYYKTAKINGCSGFKYLVMILVPCSVPSIASVAILKFINAWNSYMWPLIVTNTREMRTLPVGAAAFSSEAGTKYHILMAFSILMIAPVIVMYLFTQKYIITGVGRSGIKG